MKYLFSFLLLLIRIPFVCGQTIQVTIDPSYTYQTMAGFSASDCWSGNYVGKYWDDDKKELIAKYLFSQNYKPDGSPEGIGLSMWRFNLGAGTAEQGDASDIGDISRRCECFLNEAGEYDWTKQAGQQYFLEKAQSYGCNQFVAFSNSPLTIFTRNGKGYSDGDGNSNLRSDKYEAFSEYLATVLDHFAQKGLTFSYISPLNEPQYDWKGPDPGQEGSPWQNSEIKKLAVELDKSIAKRNMNTKILLSEAGSWEYLTKDKGRASNQLYDFFDKRSADYIGDLTSLANVIGAHSYWTHWDNETLKNTRYDAKTESRKYGLGVFQTEWSMLSGASADAGFVENMDDASYMDIALFMAKIIYSDLAFADVSSWSYWTAMDVERWNHKDRFLLLALEPGGNPYNPVTVSGNVYDRSTLWVLGNYSFFVRPQYKRIKLDGADNLNGVLGTAYLAPDSSRIVAVYVNMTYDSQNIQITFNNAPRNVLTNKRYLTNNAYNLKKYGSSSSDVYLPDRILTIPARSVMTVVHDLDTSSSGIEKRYTENQYEVYPNPVKDILYIQSDRYSSGVCSILDPAGRLILKKQIRFDETDSAAIGMDSYAKGFYIVNIEQNDGTRYSTKITKQ